MFGLKNYIEAVYIFPLGEVSVTAFSAKIGDKTLTGKLLEKTKALQQYDDNIAKGNGTYMLNEGIEKVT